jgi:hypothetical protein
MHGRPANTELEGEARLLWSDAYHYHTGYHFVPEYVSYISYVSYRYDMIAVLLLYSTTGTQYRVVALLHCY